MKEITIKIEHNLAPNHSNLMNEMLYLNMKAFERFWNEKSVKEFNIRIYETSR